MITRIAENFRAVHAGKRNNDDDGPRCFSFPPISMVRVPRINVREMRKLVVATSWDWNQFGTQSTVPEWWSNFKSYLSEIAQFKWRKCWRIPSSSFKRKSAGNRSPLKDLFTLKIRRRRLPCLVTIKERVGLSSFLPGCCRIDSISSSTGVDTRRAGGANFLSDAYKGNVNIVSQERKKTTKSDLLIK